MTRAAGLAGLALAVFVISAMGDALRPAERAAERRDDACARTVREAGRERVETPVPGV